MKVIIVFATTLLAVNALNAQEQWSKFKVTHGKNYQNKVEENLRFEVYKSNLKLISEHNARFEAGLETYKMGDNKFADLTSKEFGDLLKFRNGKKPKVRGSRHVQVKAAPESIDWRQKNAVLEVKDQKQCGSCWAFSATGALEGQNYLVNNKSVTLSEQQLLDCSREYGNGDCSVGGEMSSAFEYVIDNGLMSEEEYPYMGIDLKCFSKHSSSVISTDYKVIDTTEEDLKNAVGTVGPIAVAIYADPIQLYDLGIFKSKKCYNTAEYLNHGVLAVGYGEENGVKYWIVKNSWGSSWGENGYFRLTRDADQCGIALDSSYPIVF